MSEKTVAQVMHKGVIACRPDTSMNQVVRIVSTTDLIKEMRGSHWVWYMG